MLTRRVALGLTHERIVVERGGRKEGLWFFPGESFNAVERAYFLQILYDFPIVRGKITSRYGSRADPFTGDASFHNGIDIGAPEGTAVHAARDGSVAEVGTSPLLGSYVVITHPGRLADRLRSPLVRGGRRRREGRSRCGGGQRRQHGQGDGTAPAFRGSGARAVPSTPSRCSR